MNRSASDIQRTMSVVALGAALAMSGCSSTPPPRSELAQAEQAVNEALSENAMEFAALEVQKAREKLALAQDAMRDEDYKEAKRFSEQALVDAELAVAKADAGKAQQSAQELERTIERLRDEAQLQIEQRQTQ
ncbi:MAG: DUF4398 domain-containing protein [Thiogranum sp.]|nr:DUF4398 domain-containing protein [Thiogranum sp.]